MDGYVVVEIVISLAFIYVIYSLLATVFVETFASIFRLRGRMLRIAVRRMLQDGRKVDPDHDIFTTPETWLGRRGSWLQGKTKDRGLVQRFFAHPSIKYLGKNEVNSTPSYIGRETFSKTMIDILSSEHGISDKESIENSLGYYEQFDKTNVIAQNRWDEFLAEVKGINDDGEKAKKIDAWLSKYNQTYLEEAIEFTDLEVKTFIKEINKKNSGAEKLSRLEDWVSRLESTLVIEEETRMHLCTLYKQSGGSLNEFEKLLGDWFDNTMDRTKGWYKKLINRITFGFGLFVAVAFNVDSIHIMKTLQEDTVRKEMVELAEKTGGQDLQTAKDSLSNTQAEMQNIIAFTPCESNNTCVEGEKKTFPLLPIIGWLMTALAISLGAPFWFDLLNKMIKLKTSLPPPPPPEEQTKSGKKGKSADVINRKIAKG